MLKAEFLSHWSDEHGTDDWRKAVGKEIQNAVKNSVECQGFGVGIMLKHFVTNLLISLYDKVSTYVVAVAR